MESLLSWNMTNKSLIFWVSLGMTASVAVLVGASLVSSTGDLRLVEEHRNSLGVTPAEVWRLRDQAIWLRALSHLIAEVPAYLLAGAAIGSLGWFGNAKLGHRINACDAVVLATLRRYALFAIAAILFTPLATASMQLLCGKFSIYSVMVGINGTFTIHCVKSTLLCLLVIDLCKAGMARVPHGAMPRRPDKLVSPLGTN